MVDGRVDRLSLAEHITNWSEGKTTLTYTPDTLITTLGRVNAQGHILRWHGFSDQDLRLMSSDFATRKTAELTGATTMQMLAVNKADHHSDPEEAVWVEDLLDQALFRSRAWGQQGENLLELAKLFDSYGRETWKGIIQRAKIFIEPTILPIPDDHGLLDRWSLARDLATGSVALQLKAHGIPESIHWTDLSTRAAYNRTIEAAGKTADEVLVAEQFANPLKLRSRYAHLFPGASALVHVVEGSK